MAENTQVVMNTPEHEYINQTQEKPPIITKKIKKDTSKKAARVGSLIGLLVFVLGSIIPSKQTFYN